MGSRGRSSPAYRAARAAFQAGATCWMCGTYGRMTVDHVPPLSTAPTPEAWTGELRPACARCQSQQGAQITNRRNQGPTWRL